MRLQGAIQYTVNSDLPFPSDGWRLSDRGRQIIARLAQKLAPSEQNHIHASGYTDNEAAGPALKAEGIASNLVPSQSRADNVMKFIVSQGVKPDLMSARVYGEMDPVA